MTSSGDKSAPPAHASQGWLSAHALDAGEGMAGWWGGPLGAARAAAAGLRRPFPGSRDAEAAWREFQRPWRAAEEHLGLLRDPVGVLGTAPAVGAGAAGAGEPVVETALEPGTGGATGTPEAARPEYGIGNPGGATRGKASTGGIGKTLPGLVTRTGTGSAAARGISPRKAGADSAAGVPGSEAPARDRATRESHPIRPRPPVSRPVLAHAPSPFQAWAERVGGALRRLAPGLATGRVTGANDGVSRPTAWMLPDAAEAQARFMALVEREAAAPAVGSLPAQAGPGEVALTGRSFASEAPSGSHARGPGGERAGLPELSRLVEILGAPAGVPPRDGSPREAALDPATATIRGGVAPAAPEAVRPAGDAPTVIHRLPWPDTPPPSGAPEPMPRRLPADAETEWLDEEDDLAARLHRLLRRQARRHGVDLP